MRKITLRLWSLFMVMVLLLSAFSMPVQAADEVWIEVSDAAGLISIGNNLSGNYRLTADIDLAGTEWIPIGAFSGKLDGNSKVIRNLTINNTSTSDKGLFSSIVAPGTISNLGIENANITAGSNAGILAGTNSGTISSCYSKGSISGYEYVGGLVGKNTGIIESSFTQASVSGKDYFGGLAGENSGTVQKSYAASSVLPSVFNNYLQFNGTPVGDYSVANSGGYINIPHKDIYMGDKFTVEAWFQWDDVGTSDCNFIMGKGYEQFEIHTGGNSGKNGLRFIPIWNESGDSYFDVKNVIQSGWFHVAAVYEYNPTYTSKEVTARVYVNGEAQELWRGTVSLGKEATISRPTNTLGYEKVDGAYIQKTSPINIGRRTDGWYHFDGKISDVRFWNIARTGEDIKRDKDKVLIGNETGLVGYWKLNEASGDAIDSNLNTTQNNGTLIGDVVRTSETAAAHKGGLIGNNTITGIVSNSYYDSEVSGQADAIGTPKSTTDMKLQSTFTGWDFISTWNKNSGINSGYPYLLTKPQQVYVSNSGNDDSNTGSFESPFATINKAIAVVPDNGTICLLSDLTQSGVSFTTTNKTVTIRNNIGATTPYSIKYSGGVSSDRFFDINNGNTLNLYNVSITGDGVSSRRGIYVSGGATLNMYEGTTVSGFTASSGAGVDVVGATFNMYGGTITGNTATGNGGGVYVDSSAVFNMNGNAKISNNESKHYLGGGVYINSGTFNMGESSIIENNTVTSSDGYASGFGGGVCVGTNCTGPTVAFMNMTGNAIIRNNTATNQGGGVMVEPPGSFHMGGNSSISGNTANYGGGISLVASDTLYLSDSASITTNKAVWGGAGVSIWQYNFHISGSVVVSNNFKGSILQNISSENTENKGNIIIDGVMAEGANVNDYNVSVMKNTCPSDYVKYFHADQANYSFMESGDKFILVQNQAAPTGLVGVAPTRYGLSDGKITGTTTAITTDMQYKLSSATEWTAVTGTQITGLSAGTYNVRYAAKTGYNVGTAAEVVIAQGAKGIDATLSNLTIDGNTVAGFSANSLTYNVQLTAGTTTVPAVVATEKDTSKANAVVTATTSLPGTTSVLVTAEDGITTKTYTIKFIVALTTNDVTISDIPSYTYTGSEISTDPTIKYGNITLVKGTDYDLSYSNNTNVGTATLTISFKGNYSGSATKSFTITKATKADLSITNYNKEYDGASHSIAVTNTIAGDTVKYSKDSGTTWLSENPVFTNAGEYTVNVKVTNTNYNDIVRTGTVKITPKAVTIAVAAASKVYGAADPTFSGTVTGLAASGDLGTVSYSRTNATVNDAGTYTDVLDASYTANGNYTVAVNKGDLTITPANTMTVSAANVVKTYDGNSYGVEATSNISGAAIKYWNGTAYILDASPTIANAGDSPLTVQFQATHPNYVAVTGLATVTINLKAPTIQSAVSGDGHVNINWSTVEGSTGYKIFSSTTSGSIGLELETVSGAAYSYDVTGLTNGTTYYFVVKATNPGGDSAYSNEVSAMPKTVPGVPTNVMVTAGNGQATVSFTAPTENGGSPITEYIVTSSPGNIEVTGTGTTITVIGLTNGTIYTFTVKAENEVGTSSESAASNAVTPYRPSSGDSDRDSTPVTPSQTTNGVDILVNGKTEIAAAVTTTQNSNNTVTTIVIDDKKLEQRLVQEGKNSVVTIPANSDAEVVVGQLNGQTVKNMETNEAVLEIKTGQATYTLPALQINIDAISEQIGKGVTLKDIVVSVKISEPTADTAKIIEVTAKKNNYQIMVKPVGFEISCSSGSKTVEVSKFNAYVERLIAIPKGVEPSRITTGIVLNADGTFSHVPTVITIIDGKYYAKINSLTNSIYSVISSPKNFTDVQNHWAKEAVNDMASRLVISGETDSLFYPDKDITRAEFTSIVVRALGLMRSGTGKDVFNDVLKKNWYYDAVSIAYEYGIISGYGNDKFGPEDTVTREQAMTMIARAMEITNLTVSFESGEKEQLFAAFSDIGQASDWAKSSIASCIKAELVSGRNGKLIAPMNNITRAEVAIIVQRLLQKSNLV